MPAPLNRQPNGLLDFFGIKNGGENPLELGRILQPQLDTLPLYENAAPTEVGSVSGALAFGPVLFGPAGATTEPGASWHFRSVAISVNSTGAGDQAYVELGAYNGLTFVPFTGVLYGNQALLAAALPGVSGLYIRDLWLPPGWALAYNTLGVAGAPTFVATWWGYQYRW